MTILNAQFDGKKIALDDPVPEDLAPNTQVRVLIGTDEPRPKSLDKIATMAVSGVLPKDFSMQHKHYAKGLERR